MMNLFYLLENNKGTVSSALGKELAQKILRGNYNIINEAVSLCTYDINNIKSKNIRAGAAKIIEIVAEKKPELIAPCLEQLLGGLMAREPQTRWMILRTMGFCALLKPEIAQRAIKHAHECIKKKDGLVVASSADLFLGDYGAISSKHAKEIFPLLEESISNVVKNEEDWILEAFLKIFMNIDKNEKEIALSFARNCNDLNRKSTKKRVEKLYRLNKKLNNV